VRTQQRRPLLGVLKYPIGDDEVRAAKDGGDRMHHGVIE